MKERILFNKTEFKLDGWVARDGDGTLHFFTVKPKKDVFNARWYLSNTTNMIDIELLLYPTLKYEQGPKKVTITFTDRK